MRQTLGALAMLAALTCANLSAQTVKLNANIPFDFQTGKALLPAGEYSFSESGHLLIIRPVKGGRSMMILTVPAWNRAASTETRVEFKRYGNAYFLKGLWTAKSQDGIVVPQSTKERELARSVKTPQTATVALAKQ